jgi:surfeit locus 1 family protein
MKLRFRPALTAATALALIALLSLGFWQLQRLAWKNALIAQVEARVGGAPIPFAEAHQRAMRGEAMEYQPVFLEGAYAHAQERRVYGLSDGASGVYVFTPIIAADGAVWVNRGFAPDAFAAPDQRADGAPAGVIRIEGLYREPERPQGFERMVRPADHAGEGRYYTRDPALFGVAAAPRAYIDSNGRENAAQWPKGGATRLSFSNRHLEYALTWFGLAAALVGVFAAASLRKD